MSAKIPASLTVLCEHEGVGKACQECSLAIAETVQPLIEQARVEGAREALTSQADAALRTAEAAAAQGDKEWEDDARFVAREAVEYRDIHYPEEER